MPARDTVAAAARPSMRPLADLTRLALAALIAASAAQKAQPPPPPEEQRYNLTAIGEALPLFEIGLATAAAALGVYALSEESSGPDPPRSFRTVVDDGHLSQLAARLDTAPWSPRHGFALSSRVSRALRRSRPPGGLTHVAAFAIGGDVTTRGARGEFIQLFETYATALAAGSCAGGDAPVLEIDGGRMAEAGQPTAEVAALLKQLQAQSCAASLLLVRNAEAMHSAGSQALEPLLYGEGNRINTRLIVVLSVETETDLGTSCALAQQTEPGRAGEAEQRESACWGCQQELLQSWLAKEVWKRKGFAGRMAAEGVFLPVGAACRLGDQEVPPALGEAVRGWLPRLTSWMGRSEL